MKKLIGLILTLFLVAAACSDGDGVSIVTDDSATGSGDADGGDAGSGGDADGGDAGSGGDADGGDAGSGGDADGGDASGGDGGDDGGGDADGGDAGSGDAGSGGGDWCDFARSVDSANENLDFETSPQNLEAAFTEFNDLLDEARGRAPGEISDAVDKAAAAFNSLEDELRKVNFDMLELDLAAFSALDTPELQEATDAIDIYNERECGIPREEDPFEDDSGDDAIPTDGTVRDALIDSFLQSGFTQQEAECLANNVSLEDLSNAEDPEQLLQIFEDCGIGIERLAELGG